MRSIGQGEPGRGQRHARRTSCTHSSGAHTRVNHIDDSVNCERRFSNVGAHNDFAAGRSARNEGPRSCSKDALLHLRRQGRVQWHGEELPKVWAEILRFFRQLRARVLNLLLACKEEQHVTRRLALVNLQKSKAKSFERILEHLTK